MVLGAFSTYSRYCGPREAVFTAICRKNMGCDHFIVGRDHTGVADWYEDHHTRALFDSLDDLGVTPIFFEPYGFNPAMNQYDLLSAPETVVISGTQLRTALMNGDPLPDWFVRDAVQAVLRKRMANDGTVFWDEPQPVGVN